MHFTPIWYFVVLLLVLLLLYNTMISPPGETITYSQFKSLLKGGMIADLVLSEKTFRGQIGREGLRVVLPPDRLKEIGQDEKKAYPFVVVRVEDPELIAELEKAGIPFRGEVSSNWFPTLLSWLVPVALFFLLWSYLFRKMGTGSGMMQVGKSKAKVYIEKRTGVTFQDVEGIDEAEEELVEVVEFLKTPQKYQRLRGHLPKGVLLVGPPGKKNAVCSGCGR